MSPLEIVLYSLLGSAVLGYIIYSIVGWIKGKKKKEKEDE